MRLESDAIGLNDRRPKCLWNDARTWGIFSEPSDNDITCKDSVFLEAFEVRFGNVRLFVNVDTVSNVLEADNARAVFRVVLGLEV